MKRLVAICVLLSLCVSAFATGPIDLSDEQIATIRLCIAALAIQLANLSAAAATEQIGPTLRSEIEATIDTMIAILDALGYTPPALPGTRG